MLGRPLHCDDAQHLTVTWPTQVLGSYNITNKAIVYEIDKVLQPDVAPPDSFTSFSATVNSEEVRSPASLSKLPMVRTI